MKEIIKKITPRFLLQIYHYFLALAGAVFYFFPSRKLIVIGVTGTNGKSTVVGMIDRILEEAGHKTASLSSVRFKIGHEEWENKLKMTMPGRMKIQRFLRQAVTAGCGYVVLEVTSEGIRQFRHRFIKFDTAVFTNLSPEHIESHGGLKKYRACKGRLFQAAKNIHIINLDDENAEYFLKFSAKKKWGYGTKNPGSQKIVAENIRELENGAEFSVGSTKFILKILGKFNIYNALSAICVGLSEGVPLETCKKALEKITGIPGRMEIIASHPFRVFVDYAHTPEALESVYKALSQNFGSEESNLICVLGSCGGGRDKWKRPVLGKLAAKYCREIVVTNEDPYDENPEEIINQVADNAGEKAKKILDRREAIREALKSAKEKDTVVITGKGCEPWMCVERGKKIAWDDRKIAREELADLAK